MGLVQWLAVFGLLLVWCRFLSFRVGGLKIFGSFPVDTCLIGCWGWICGVSHGGG